MSVQAFARALSCCALIITTATPSAAGPQAEAPPPGSTPCIDGMETEPTIDDLQILTVADMLDVSCMASAEPISI